MNPTRHYFPSRRDWGLGIILWGPLFLTVLLPVFLPSEEKPLWPVFAIIVPTFILVGLVWFGTRYYLSPDELVAKVGPLVHTRLRLKDIRYISPSRSWMASPATSLRRLRIAYGKWDELLVSPQREEEFLDLICRYQPDVEIHTETDYWPSQQKPADRLS